MAKQGLTESWRAAEPGKPSTWRIMGVVTGPRVADPAIEGEERCAWARGPKEERVGGYGPSPQDALSMLAHKLREVPRRSEPATRSGSPSPRRDGDVGPFDHHFDHERLQPRHPGTPARGSHKDGGSTRLGRGCQSGCQPNARPIPDAGRTGVFVLRRVVPEVRLELTRACAHRCLRPTRLPIPPLRRGEPSL